MKTIKLLPFIFLLSISTSMNAQILKKLGNKLGKVVERTIETKAEEKTEQTTSNAFDSTFNKPTKHSKSNSPFNALGNAGPPANNYSFTHRYVMTFIDGKDTFDITYFLTKDGNYIGSKYDTGTKNQQDMFVVIDASRSTLFTFMTMQGKKTIMSMGFDLNKASEEAADDQNTSIKKTGRTKTILNYDCEEFKVESKDSQGSIWITKAVDVTFLNINPNKKGKKNSNQKWLSMSDGLVMEMDMVDTSKRKPKAIKMICTALENTNYTIDTSQYESLYKN